ncbi:MAG: hypothetical protein L3J39_04600 [Verrucomicrobiales bacterium]|nr:hypothetical protein [Verrucomicrobiales bacterium]
MKILNSILVILLAAVSTWGYNIHIAEKQSPDARNMGLLRLGDLMLLPKSELGFNIEDEILDISSGCSCIKASISELGEIQVEAASVGEIEATLVIRLGGSGEIALREIKLSGFVVDKNGLYFPPNRFSELGELDYNVKHHSSFEVWGSEESVSKVRLVSDHIKIVGEELLEYSPIWKRRAIIEFTPNSSSENFLTGHFLFENQKLNEQLILHWVPKNSGELEDHFFGGMVTPDGSLTLSKGSGALSSFQMASADKFTISDSPDGRTLAWSKLSPGWCSSYAMYVDGNGKSKRMTWTLFVQ